MSDPTPDPKWSIQNGDLEGVKLFVENGDVNKELEGRFPLHYAADYGHKDVIEYLLNAGAKVNQEDKHGITPLLAAVWEGHTSSVKLLLEKGADKTVKSPEGVPLKDCAEKDEIKTLLN